MITSPISEQTDDMARSVSVSESSILSTHSDLLSFALLLHIALLSQLDNHISTEQMINIWCEEAEDDSNTAKRDGREKHCLVRCRIGFLISAHSHRLDCWGKPFDRRPCSRRPKCQGREEGCDGCSWKTSVGESWRNICGYSCRQSIRQDNSIYSIRLN